MESKLLEKFVDASIVVAPGSGSSESGGGTAGKGETPTGGSGFATNRRQDTQSGHRTCILSVGGNSVAFQWSVAEHCTCAGRDTVKVVPMPGELFTSIFPPCWRMIPNALDSPSPVPLPSGLVVKNGSKIAD